jgi:hypothetical protein
MITKNHRIIATPKQIAAAQATRLKCFVLPLDLYLDTKDLALCGEGKACRDGDGNWIIHFPGDDPGLEEFTLKAYPKGSNRGIKIPFKESDRIFLAEEWGKGDWGASFEDDIYFLKSITPEAENIGWQSAETMPDKAAHLWFLVESVRVVRIGDVNVKMAIESGLTTLRHIGINGDMADLSIAKIRWDKQYPDYPWKSDRWAIVLDVASIAAPELAL